MTSNMLRELADNLRGLAKVAEELPDTPHITQEKLDSNHVINFIKFFAANDKGAQ